MSRIARVSEPMSHPPARQRRLRAAGVVALALFLAACGDERQDIFSPEGSYARKINNLQVPVFVIAGVVGVAVAVGLVYVLLQGHKRAQGDEDPRQLEGNFKLEIGWTIGPAVLLAGVAVATVATLFAIEDNPADAGEFEAMEITVYGHQWWWGYEYELDGDTGNGAEIVTANDLVIPVGVAITLNITSRDVIHSFWIPALNGTRDAVPGRVHTLNIEADAPGIFDGQCKEFCGLSHANMQQRVVALSEADFADWLDQQQEDQPMLAVGEEGAEGEPGSAGQQSFIGRCSQCHQINGLEDEEGEPIVVEGEAALVSGYAPNLTHLMSRGVYAGGLFELYDENGEFDRDTLEAWLRNAPAEKPMYTEPESGDPRGMPNLGLSEDEIDDLIEYLQTLGEPPPLQTQTEN